ncbi:MAG: hypothetical protein ACRDNJ_11005, partial [Solirubrobacteraceae bacterium]
KRGRRSTPGAQAPRSPRDAAPAGRETRPNQWFAAPTGEELTRSQRRDAEARASLTPLTPGEHPGAILVSTVVALVLALSNLVAYLAGVKIGGKHPAGGGILLFSAVMVACAVGLWRMWYGAVLGFMALLAIIAVIFALLLIEASNLLGVVVALAIVGGAGWLFFKLVRVLSRIQMPKNPKRR